MNVTAATPTPATAGGVAVDGIWSGQKVDPSAANSYKVMLVAKRLAFLSSTGYSCDSDEFCHLCYNLSRGIDYAIANNEIPAIAQYLPSFLKPICQRKNDILLSAAIMVLMISVKSACKLRWFSDKDAEELISLANEIGSCFSSLGDVCTEPKCSVSIISKIMARFYPLMKIGQILAFLEVKPGFGASWIDFYISKNTSSSPLEKIWLFVAQTDNTETSACIINPPEVNFLLNGKGVERTNTSMDPAPQLPTNVNSMLKYGSNLLQVVGRCNGHYIVAVAFMRVSSSLDTPELQDYVQPAVAALDSVLDSEIIEGPSRISLNCPISCTRIKIPVKGHSCKHLQCFDFGNFVQMNSRRPSWRCPHCYQCVCYTDVHVDQTMVKVLREVGDNVADVIISVDGSWKAVLETDVCADEAHDKTLNWQKGVFEQRESTSISNALPKVLDLEEADEMDAVGTCETEDTNPFQAILQSQSVATNLSIPSELNNMCIVNQNVAAQFEDNFLSEYHFTCGSVTSCARSDAQMVNSISQSTPANFMQPPLVTDAVALALHREADGLGDTSLSTSVMQRQFSAPNNLQSQQSQQSQVLNSIVNNEYGRLRSIPRHVTGNPVAIQALPAQFQNQRQRSRTSMNSLIPNCSSLASQAALSFAPTADGFNTVSSDMERQDLSMAKNWDHSLLSGQAVQQVVSLPGPSQLPAAHIVSSGLLIEFQNSLNPRMSQSMSQSSGAIQSSSHPPSTQTQQVDAQVGVHHTSVTGKSEHSRLMVAAQRAAWMARQPPLVPVRNQTSRAGFSSAVNGNGFRGSAGGQPPLVPVWNQTSRAGSSSAVNANGFGGSAGDKRGNMGGMLQAVSRADGLLDLPLEQNWQPGRMRGSLSGVAYSAALNQFMIRPTEPVQAARPYI